MSLGYDAPVLLYDALFLGLTKITKAKRIPWNHFALNAQHTEKPRRNKQLLTSNVHPRPHPRGVAK